MPLQRILALLLLVGCTKAPSSDELAARLASDDAETRQTAAEMLVARRDPRGLTYVRHLFLEGDVETRIRAAGVLADDEAVRFLLAQLRFNEAVVQEALSYHTTAADADAAPTSMLQRAGQTASTEGRDEVILWTLAPLRRPQSSRHLVSALSSGSFQLRSAARAGLVELGPQVVPLLEREYRRPGNHSMHGPAALLEVAAALRHADAIPLLVEGLADGDWSARQAAIDGLAQLGSTARSAVKRAQQSPDALVRDGATRALERMP